MNQLQQVASMSKEQVRQMLAKQTERYQSIYGGEITLYAPKDYNPKPLLSPANKPDKKRRLTNEREQAYKQYLEQVEAGTYQPEPEPQVDYQARKQAGKKQNRVLLTGYM